MIAPTPSVWRTVQETLYRRFKECWIDGDGEPLTPFFFANEDGNDPPNELHARFSVVRLPGGPETMGRPGNRKMARAGIVFIDLREPPGSGVGKLSDYAEFAAKIFENCRLEPHDIRFAQVEPGEASDIDKGRWWGVSVEGRFDFEELV
jgi:hypothetical protein